MYIGDDNKEREIEKKAKASPSKASGLAAPGSCGSLTALLGRGNGRDDTASPASPVPLSALPPTATVVEEEEEAATVAAETSATATAADEPGVEMPPRESSVHGAAECLFELAAVAEGDELESGERSLQWRPMEVFEPGRSKKVSHGSGREDVIPGTPAEGSGNDKEEAEQQARVEAPRAAARADASEGEAGGAG